MSDPRDQVRRLAAVVQSGQPLPRDLGCWLDDGLQAWLEAGGRQSLDRCLGLAGRGVRKADTHDAQRRRDAALMVALEFAHDGQHRDARWRARRLAAKIQRFESRTWPRVQHCSEPPAQWSRLDRALFIARAASGRALPTTPDHLLRRINRK